MNYLGLKGKIGSILNENIDKWLLCAVNDNGEIVSAIEDATKNNKFHTGIVQWYGEFIGKTLEGLSFAYKETKREDVLKEGNRVVDILNNIQGDDGYLGTYIGESRFAYKEDNWDLWNMYHIINGLIEWYKLTNNKKAFDIAYKTIECIYNHIDKYGFEMAGGNTMNLAISTAFLRMYELTKNRKYLIIGQEYVSKWDTIGGDWLNNSLKGKKYYESKLPRWEALHALESLIYLYRFTKKKDYLNGFELIYKSILEYDVHNNGSFSSEEQAIGNPYKNMIIETCCTISFLALSIRYLDVLDDVKIIDNIENGYLNGVISTLLSDHKYCTYNTPMNGIKGKVGWADGRRVPSQKDIAFQYRDGSKDFNCCQANIARGLFEVSSWNIYFKKNSLYLNYFEMGEYQIDHFGTVLIEGDYPFKNKVTIRFKDLRRHLFRLMIRIPSWSKLTKVFINNNKLENLPGKYLIINRLFKESDVINIEFDFTPRLVKGDLEMINKNSLFIGPIMMALDEKLSKTYDDSIEFKYDDILNSKISYYSNNSLLSIDVNGVKLVDFISAGKQFDNKEFSQYVS